MPRFLAVGLAALFLCPPAGAQAPAAKGAAGLAGASDETRRLLLRLAGPVPLRHTRSISSLVIAPDGRTVTTVSNAEARVFVWDALTGEQLREWRLPQGWIAQSAVGAGGKVLAATDRAGRVALWDAAAGKPLHVLKGTAGPRLAFAPDGKALVAGLANGQLGVWDVATGKLRAALPGSSWTVARSLAFSSDGKRFAAPRLDGKVGVWDAASGKEVAALPTGTPDIHLLAFAPDGKGLASCDGGGQVRVWDVAAARERRRMQLPGQFAPTCGFFTPDGRALLTGGADGTVRLWEMGSGKERHRFPAHANLIVGAALTPDGRSVVIAGADNLALVRDVGGHAPADNAFGAAPPEDLETAWADLAADDAARAYRAVAALAERRAQAVTFLKDRVRPAAAPGNDTVARLLRDLDSRVFATRQRAMRDLTKLHDQAEAALEAALRGNPPLEVRQRVRQLLDRVMGLAVPAERLQTLRAIEALELIATPEARQILQRLAGGANGDRVTEEARAALVRLLKAPARPR